MKPFFTLGCLLLVSTLTPSQQHVASQYEISASRDRAFFRLGENIITVSKLTHSQERSFVLVSLHHDESTAINAAQEFVEEYGGQLVYIENDEEHLISFQFLDENYSLDPNKIFTKKGRSNFLKKNPFNNTLYSEVHRFSRFLFQAIPYNKHVIGVHSYEGGKLNMNTMNKRYMPRNVKSIHKNDKKDIHDFFLTTDAGIYRHLSGLGFNVVLQNHAVVRDDGSLGIVVEKNKRHYVDVYVRTGHHEEQKEMLQALAEILER